MPLTVASLSQQLSGAFLCHVVHSRDTICTARVYKLSHLENVKCDHVFCVSRKWLTMGAFHYVLAPPSESVQDNLVSLISGLSNMWSCTITIH